VLGLFGSFGTVVFPNRLVVSCLGLALLPRRLVRGWPWQLLWAFLLPVLAGSILLQRHFEPAILVIMFLAARPNDALNVLDRQTGLVLSIGRRGVWAQSDDLLRANL
jgi:hypothetical protein